MPQFATEPHATLLTSGPKLGPKGVQFASEEGTGDRPLARKIDRKSTPWHGSGNPWSESVGEAENHSEDVIVKEEYSSGIVDLMSVKLVPVKVVLLSNKAAAAKTVLASLQDAGHSVRRVFTYGCSASAVVDAAKSLPVTVLDLDKEKRDEFWHQVQDELNDAVLVSCGWIQIPVGVIEAAKFALNLHPSDLPKYRGGVPLQAAILRGDRTFKICCHDLTAQLDKGVIRSRTPSLPLPEDITSCIEMLGAKTGDLVVEAIAAVQTGAAPLKPADDTSLAMGIRRVRWGTGFSNAGVTARSRVAFQEDSAVDIERAQKAFGSVLVEVDGRYFRCQITKVLETTLAAQPAGTFAEVSETSIRVWALDGVLMQLCGSFDESAEPPTEAERWVPGAPRWH